MSDTDETEPVEKPKKKDKGPGPDQAVTLARHVSPPSEVDE